MRADAPARYHILILAPPFFNFPKCKFALIARMGDYNPDKIKRRNCTFSAV